MKPDACLLSAQAWRPVIHLNLVRCVNFILRLYTGDAQPSSPDNTSSDQLQGLLVSLVRLHEVEEMLFNLITGFQPPKEKSEAHQYDRAKVPEISGAGRTALLQYRRWSASATERNKQEKELQTRKIWSACVDDIMTLWALPDVQKSPDHEMVLQDQSGFFLDDVQHDILRARVDTVGTEEHFYPDRRSRKVEVLDAFDELLPGNDAVNQLEDLFQVWQSLCSNTKLEWTKFILFLNKVDTFTRKIQSGTQFAKYVPSYGDRPNEPEEIIKYLSAKFTDMHNIYSPPVLPTSRTHLVRPNGVYSQDRKATARTISHAHEFILQNTLDAANIL
ncbi:G-alpha-domain-containing protein [Mycena venus]|uniref:G-alpha-domain-containing protein n=1 Tax=Mycena venus TaxID=2733690 RepID=A0A8H6YVC0_9AGAR|nr:G-alpha-domain-containing protein [Mycena venus]